MPENKGGKKKMKEGDVIELDTPKFRGKYRILKLSFWDKGIELDLVKVEEDTVH